MTDSTTTAASYVGVGQWCAAQTTLWQNNLMPRKDQTETATNVFTVFMEGLRSIEVLSVGGWHERRLPKQKRAPWFASFNFQFHSFSDSVKLWFQSFRKMLFVNPTAFYEKSCSQITNYWLSGYWRRIATFFTSPICIRICIMTHSLTLRYRPKWRMCSSVKCNAKKISVDILKGFTLKPYTLPFQWALSIFCSCNASTSGGYLSSSLATMDFPSG